MFIAADDVIITSHLSG